MMTEETKKKLGIKIRESRKNRHLTQQQLAESIGLKQHQISDVERGADEDVGRYRTIACKLGIVLDERIEEIDIFKASQEDEDLDRIIRRLDKLLEPINARYCQMDSTIFCKLLEIASK